MYRKITVLVTNIVYDWMTRCKVFYLENLLTEMEIIVCIHNKIYPVNHYMYVFLINFDLEKM